LILKEVVVHFPKTSLNVGGLNSLPSEGSLIMRRKKRKVPKYDLQVLTMEIG
jgi:hypothetical protein